MDKPISSRKISQPEISEKDRSLHRRILPWGISHVEHQTDRVTSEIIAAMNTRPTDCGGERLYGGWVLCRCVARRRRLRPAPPAPSHGDPFVATRYLVAIRIERARQPSPYAPVHRLVSGGHSPSATGLPPRPVSISLSGGSTEFGELTEVVPERCAIGRYVKYTFTARCRKFSSSFQPPQ